MNTEYLLFGLVCVLAVTPLVLLVVVLNRVTLSGSLGFELGAGERRARVLTAERDEARAEAERLRVGLAPKVWTHATVEAKGHTVTELAPDGSPLPTSAPVTVTPPVTPPVT